jgi:hypothetical protein
MEEASQKLEVTDLDENHLRLKEAKELLCNTYDKLKEEKAIEMCNRIQATHGDGRYSEAWKVVNEMTGIVCLPNPKFWLNLKVSDKVFFAVDYCSIGSI